MNEFVKRLYDFKGIYIIFWNQNSYYRYFLKNSTRYVYEIKSRNFIEI